MRLKPEFGTWAPTILLLIRWGGTYYLWNWLAPNFHLPRLTQGQALGLVVLCRVLFLPARVTWKVEE